MISYQREVKKINFRIGVISKEYVQKEVKEEFCQICHEKENH